MTSHYYSAHGALFLRHSIWSTCEGPNSLWFYGSNSSRLVWASQLFYGNLYLRAASSSSWITTNLSDSICRPQRFTWTHNQKGEGWRWQWWEEMGHRIRRCGISQACVILSPFSFTLKWKFCCFSLWTWWSMRELDRYWDQRGSTAKTRSDSMLGLVLSIKGYKETFEKRVRQNISSQNIIW